MAQTREGRQHRHTVVLEVPDQVEHLLPLALEPTVVEAAVGRRELDLDDLLLLGRQVEEDVLLGPAQQEGGDAPTQDRHA